MKNELFSLRSKISNGLLESDPSMRRLKTTFNKSVENLSQMSEEKMRKRSAGSLSDSFRFTNSQLKIDQKLEKNFEKIQVPDQVKNPPPKPRRKNAVSPLALDLSRLNENASQNL